MKTISIKDSNGKEYVFDDDGRGVNLLCVKFDDGMARIIGWLRNDINTICPFTVDENGNECMWVGYNPISLKRAKIETVMSIKELEEKFGIVNLRIKE